MGHLGAQPGVAFGLAEELDQFLDLRLGGVLAGDIGEAHLGRCAHGPVAARLEKLACLAAEGVAHIAPHAAHQEEIDPDEQNPGQDPDERVAPHTRFLVRQDGERHVSAGHPLEKRRIAKRRYPGRDCFDICTLGPQGQRTAKRHGGGIAFERDRVDCVVVEQAAELAVGQLNPRRRRRAALQQHDPGRNQPRDQKKRDPVGRFRDVHHGSMGTSLKQQTALPALPH